MQEHIVHGVGLVERPALMNLPDIKQLFPVSAHLFMSGEGRLEQETRGFLR